MKIRQPIVTVLGHVDHGKTKLLDRIRGTAIAEKEAGAITQYIGATAMPMNLIERIAGRLMQQYGFEAKAPGLLFIDTPGHAAFASLRERGGSIADLAVLVVDVMQGFQPQTVEAISILKTFKTPFVVGANKIDLLSEWESSGGEFSENVKRQSQKALAVLDEKVYAIVGELYKQGFQADRFDRCTDFRKQVPIVPLSAKTGEGLPELLMLLIGLSQRFLEKNLLIDEDEPGKGTVLEVKEERGLGTTVDVILYSGILSVNDRIVLGGREQVIETKVRALLMPKPLQEISAPGSDKFVNVRDVHAAAGVKIAAPGLESALAGSPFLVERVGDEKSLVEREVASVKQFTGGVGPIVKADTLGSLEAMMVLLGKEANLKPKRADVGEVTRHDVVEAAAENDRDPLKAVIFAFNVGIEESALLEASKRNVHIISGSVVYRLMEEYADWVRKQLLQRKQDALARLSLPVKLRFMQGFVFRHSKPAVVGVRVLEGKLRPGVKLLNDKGKIVGIVSAVQVQGKSIDMAIKGQEVAVSVDRGVVGRNLHENGVLYAYIPVVQFGELTAMRDFLSFDEQELLGEIFELEKKRAKVEEE